MAKRKRCRYGKAHMAWVRSHKKKK